MALPEAKSFSRVRALTPNADENGILTLIVPLALSTGTPTRWSPSRIVSTQPVGTILVGQAVSNGKIAFVSDRDGNNEIYTMNPDGTGVTRLTFDTVVSHNDLSPAWSPDGTKIAFASDRDGNYEIYTMNADDSGPTRLTSNLADDASPTWSHDGTKIAFVRYLVGGNYEIYDLDADLCHECTGTGPTNLSQSASADLEPAWSPDGTKIAFASNRD